MGWGGRRKENDNQLIVTRMKRFARKPHDSIAVASGVARVDRLKATKFKQLGLFPPHPSIQVAVSGEYDSGC